jgi:hypothetical protein
MKALGVPEPGIRAIRDLKPGAKAAISTTFSLPDLIEAGFEATAHD